MFLMWVGDNQELHVYGRCGFIWKTINIERSDPLHNSGVQLVFNLWLIWTITPQFWKWKI